MSRALLLFASSTLIILLLLALMTNFHGCSSLITTIYAWSSLIYDFDNYLVPARYITLILKASPQWKQAILNIIATSPYLWANLLPTLFYGIIGLLIPWWLLIAINQLATTIVQIHLIYKILQSIFTTTKHHILIPLSALILFITIHLLTLRFGPTQWGIILFLMASLLHFRFLKGQIPLPTYIHKLATLTFISTFIYIFTALLLATWLTLLLLWATITKQKTAIKPAPLILLLLTLASGMLISRIGQIISPQHDPQWFDSIATINSRIPHISVRILKGISFTLFIFLPLFLLSFFNKNINLKNTQLVAIIPPIAIVLATFQSLLTGKSAQEWHFWIRFAPLTFSLTGIWILSEAKNSSIRYTLGIISLLFVLYTQLIDKSSFLTSRIYSAHNQWKSTRDKICNAWSFIMNNKNSSWCNPDSPSIILAPFDAAYPLQLLCRTLPLPYSGSLSIANYPLTLARQLRFIAELLHHDTVVTTPTTQADTLYPVPFDTRLFPYPYGSALWTYKADVINQLFLLKRLSLLDICKKPAGTLLLKEPCTLYIQSTLDTCRWWKTTKSITDFRRLRFAIIGNCLLKHLTTEVSHWINNPNHILKNIDSLLHIHAIISHPGNKLTRFLTQPQTCYANLCVYKLNRQAIHQRSK